MPEEKNKSVLSIGPSTASESGENFNNAFGGLKVAVFSKPKDRSLGAKEAKGPSAAKNKEKNIQAGKERALSEDELKQKYNRVMGKTFRANLQGGHWIKIAEGDLSTSKFRIISSNQGLNQKWIGWKDLDRLLEEYKFLEEKNQKKGPEAPSQNASVEMTREGVLAWVDSFKSKTLLAIQAFPQLTFKNKSDFDQLLSKRIVKIPRSQEGRFEKMSVEDKNAILAEMDKINQEIEDALKAKWVDASILKPKAEDLFNGQFLADEFDAGSKTFAPGVYNNGSVPHDAEERRRSIEDKKQIVSGAEDTHDFKNFKSDYEEEVVRLDKLPPEPMEDAVRRRQELNGKKIKEMEADERKREGDVEKEHLLIEFYQEFAQKFWDLFQERAMAEFEKWGYNRRDRNKITENQTWAYLERKMEEENDFSEDRQIVIARIMEKVSGTV